MERRLLPLALSATATVTVAFACMAMVPTNPAITRPPLASTTQPDTTTTSTMTTMITTTTMTTTTPAPPCDKCDDVFYKDPSCKCLQDGLISGSSKEGVLTVPDAATICGGPAFYCTDDDLLSRTLTGSCKTSACTNGKLFAYDSAGTPQPVTGDLACAFKNQAVFEDDSAPPVSFPNGASVFCKVETACQKCPAVTYMEVDNAEVEEVFFEKPFLGKHGCPIKDCFSYQLRYVDQSAILHSVTCNPALPGFIDKNKMPVTKPVACYDCGCSWDEAYSTLCPPGYFCQDEYTSAENCQSLCSPGDLFIALKDKRTTRVAPEDVYCDLSNKWQPFRSTDALLLATCATPVDQLLTTQPVLAKCPPLEDLGGGAFSNVFYKSNVRLSGAQIVFAVCRNGMMASGTSVPSAGPISSYVYCDSREGGWFDYYNTDIVITKVTCKPNSCVDFVLSRGYTQAQIEMINLVEETGRCRATCKNGANFKDQDGVIVPKSLVIYDEFFEYANDFGNEQAESISW